MACIACLAVLAAVGISTGIAVNEWLDKKLASLAESGTLVHESESVATWRGDLHATLDDGSATSVSTTIRVYKDSGRVAMQIDDHSLTQSEAERLEDEAMSALDATIVERRYPPTGPDGLPVCNHSHEEPLADEADGKRQGHKRRR
jgi:hypothetical protein